MDLSQVQVIGNPPPRSWDDFEQGCLSTYSGGHTGEQGEAFRHGMSTVFNLLRAEFPSAAECRVAPELVAALRAVIDCMAAECRRRSPEANNGTGLADPEEQVAFELARAALAKAEG